MPVGNKGFTLINGRDLIPDFFDGDSSLASDGLGKQPLQISPPATAKNIVSVGATCEDTGTMFGPFNEEENVQNFTSKGPATGTSLRAAPIVVGVGNDRAPTGGGPAPMGMYSLRSRDNNQNGPVEVEIDQQARGTSFGAASVASGAAIMQDYLPSGVVPHRRPGPGGPRCGQLRSPDQGDGGSRCQLHRAADWVERKRDRHERQRRPDATTRGSVLSRGSRCHREAATSTPSW